MLASLPMYYAPAEAIDAFWRNVAAGLRRRGVTGVPQTLDWPTDPHTHWLDPGLLLSQTCGYPLTHALRGRVTLVGSLAYDVPGAAGIDCRSHLICRASDARSSLRDFAQSSVAFNSTNSQSGYNALRLEVALAGGPRPFFRHTIETGSHAKSLESVRFGLADLAAIDCVTWALWQEANPQAASTLRVLGSTQSYPGLPLITSLDTSAQQVQALRESLAGAIAEPALQPALRALHITAFVVSTLDDYARCLAMEAQAAALGLTVL